MIIMERDQRCVAQSKARESTDHDRGVQHVADDDRCLASSSRRNQHRSLCAATLGVAGLTGASSINPLSDAVRKLAAEGAEYR